MRLALTRKSVLLLVGRWLTKVGDLFIFLCSCNYKYAALERRLRMDVNFRYSLICAVVFLVSRCNTRVIYAMHLYVTSSLKKHNRIIHLYVERNNHARTHARMSSTLTFFLQTPSVQGSCILSRFQLSCLYEKVVSIEEQFLAKCFR
jgi:hypothetical protein